MRTITAAFLAYGISFCDACMAGSTDFEDLIVGEYYLPGDTIMTKGLKFTMREIDAGFGGSALGVLNRQDAGNYLNGFGNGSPGLEFLLDRPVSLVSMQFYSGGRVRSMVVNGDDYVIDSLSFSSFDGQTLSGVAVEADVQPRPGGELVSLTLRGPIASFTPFIGVESEFYSVAVTVPEPSPGVLALMIGLSAHRQRIRCRGH